MNKLTRLMAIAGVAVAFLLAVYGLVTAPKIEPATKAQTATPERADKLRREYRDAVLRRLELGDRVAVPDDRIGDLSGAVKLIEKRDVSKSRTDVRKTIDLKSGSIAEIDSVASRLTDPALRDGLSSFARNASEQERAAFLNGGRFYVDNFGTKAVPQPTEDAEKKCRDSCETITSILCKEVCNWDCRIVNGEKVCEKSCSTICPEITNIVCKKVCD